MHHGVVIHIGEADWQTFHHIYPEGFRARPNQMRPDGMKLGRCKTAFESPALLTDQELTPALLTQFVDVLAHCLATHDERLVEVDADR